MLSTYVVQYMLPDNVLVDQITSGSDESHPVRNWESASKLHWVHQQVSVAMTSKRQESNSEPKNSRKSHLAFHGGWKSSARLARPVHETETLQTEWQAKYSNFPLVRDMLIHEGSRCVELFQVDSPAN